MEAPLSAKWRPIPPLTPAPSPPGYGDQGTWIDGVLWPRHLIDPISLRPLVDPVLAADGYTYSRYSIENRFDSLNYTSPVTGRELDHTRLTPNYPIREAAEKFRASISSVDRQMVEQEQPLAAIEKVANQTVVDLGDRRLTALELDCLFDVINPRCTKLRFNGGGINYKQMLGFRRVMKDCTQLKELAVMALQEVHPNDWNQLVEPKPQFNLTVLALPGARITDQALQALQFCLKDLQTLDLSDCKTPGEKGWDVLAAAQFSSSLVELNLAASSVSERALKRLVAKSQVRSLDLSYCNNVSNWLAVFKALPAGSITCFKIAGNPLSKRALATLEKKLIACKFVDFSFTSRFQVFEPNLPNLQTLQMRGCRDLLRFDPKLDVCTELNFACYDKGSDIFELFIDRLEKNAALTSLTLNNCDLPSPAMVILSSNLLHCSQLDLRNCTSDGWENLVLLEPGVLQQLKLSRSNIGDPGLKALAINLGNCHLVELDNCHHITSQGIASLSAHLLPTADISASHCEKLKLGSVVSLLRNLPDGTPIEIHSDTESTLKRSLIVSSRVHRLVVGGNFWKHSYSKAPALWQDFVDAMRHLQLNTFEVSTDELPGPFLIRIAHHLARARKTYIDSANLSPAIAGAIIGAVPEGTNVNFTKDRRTLVAEWNREGTHVDIGMSLTHPEANERSAELAYSHMYHTGLPSAEKPSMNLAWKSFANAIRLPVLTSVDLSGSAIDDAALSILARNLLRCTCLNLSDTPVTGNALKALQPHLRKIRSLLADDCSLIATQLKHLVALPGNYEALEIVAGGTGKLSVMPDENGRIRRITIGPTPTESAEIPQRYTTASWRFIVDSIPKDLLTRFEVNRRALDYWAMEDLIPKLAKCDSFSVDFGHIKDAKILGPLIARFGSGLHISFIEGRQLIFRRECSTLEIGEGLLPGYARIPQASQQTPPVPYQQPAQSLLSAEWEEFFSSCFGGDTIACLDLTNTTLSGAQILQVLKNQRSCVKIGISGCQNVSDQEKQILSQLKELTLLGCRRTQSAT